MFYNNHFYTVRHFYVPFEFEFILYNSEIVHHKQLSIVYLFICGYIGTNFFNNLGFAIFS